MAEKDSRHFDFDAFLAEKEKSGPTITIFGQVEELPPALPAIIMVKTVRMMKAKQTEAQIEDLLEMSYAIFGKERFESWLEKGLSVEDLNELIRRVIELYTGTPSRGGRRG